LGGLVDIYGRCTRLSEIMGSVLKVAQGRVNARLRRSDGSPRHGAPRGPHSIASWMQLSTFGCRLPLPIHTVASIQGTTSLYEFFTDASFFHVTSIPHVLTWAGRVDRLIPYRLIALSTMQRPYSSFGTTGLMCLPSWLRCSPSKSRPGHHLWCLSFHPTFPYAISCFIAKGFLLSSFPHLDCHWR
jgi:hypothetical protein